MPATAGLPAASRSRSSRQQRDRACALSGRQRFGSASDQRVIFHYATQPARRFHCDFGCGKTTGMITPEEQSFLTKALDPLRGLLHDVLPAAVEIADAHYGDFDMDASNYRASRAHLARAHAKRLLLGANWDQLAGWTVAESGPNARLWLTRGTLNLRLLRPMPDAQAPPPGPNGARVAYYSNAHASLFGVAGSDLIALWDVPRNGDALIRIVRPRGAWRAGSMEKVDFDFYLPRPPSSIADLEFIPEDELNLPLPFEADEQDGEEGVDDSDR